MEAESSRSPELRVDWRTALLLAAAAAISVLAYVAAAGLTYRIGFPLDDAWIHLTYARNLALHGQWAFLPGETSGGSTAPLWSALLAVGQRLGLGPYVWAWLLGGLELWVLALLVELTVRRAAAGYRPRIPWAGLLIAVEWHLVWAAASGMETLLHALLVTSVLALLIAGSRAYAGLGLLTGISLWVRPDGLTLLAPLALVILLESPGWRARLRDLLKLALGFGILLACYLAFNLMVAGTPWPNTYYAKQAEYAALLSQPFALRFLQQALLPLAGAGVLLLPGSIGLGFFAVRERRWPVLAAGLWLIGYLGLYALRLPVTYQHGRYMIPAMPLLFLSGVIGLVLWPAPRARLGALLHVAWRLSLGALAILFWAVGAGAYGADVAVIESEMVDTARWVQSNLPPGSVLAAHDIGALGYFGGHRLVDLAGLISPEVVPFLRDEGRLSAYLDRRGVDYLVTFPGWYPRLVAGRDRVFTAAGRFAPAQGGENMAVYRWRRPR